MRILLLGINFAPEITGIGKFTGEMAEHLASSGHEVRVVTAPPYYPYWQVQKGYRSAWYSKETWHSVQVIRCPLLVPRRPTGLTRLLNLLSFAATSLPAMILQAAWRPRLVMVVVPAIFSAPSAWLCAKLSRAKSWIHIQDFELEAAMNLGMLPGRQWVDRFAGWLETRVLGLFDQISTISLKMQQRLWEKGIPQGKTTLFENWVDTEAIRPMGDDNLYRREWGIQRDELVVLYAGNIGKKQGLETLVDAACLVRDHPYLRFIIAGEGAAREAVEQRARDLERIRFIPLQPFERLNDLLNAADIHVLVQQKGAEDLVMPSKLSGMLASGKPVVGTANPETELGQIVAQTGMLIQPGDPESLVKAILQLAGDASLRKELGEKGRRYAVEHFSKKQILEVFTGKITELAALPRNHRE
jgi:colanic acid biosynthesis glycosyl transferase WcaI